MGNIKNNIWYEEGLVNTNKFFTLVDKMTTIEDDSDLKMLFVFEFTVGLSLFFLSGLVWKTVNKKK